MMNLKETELRLGLPGSESPEKKSGNGVSIFGKDLKDEAVVVKNSSVSGAKRGFSFAINKWVLSINGGSEPDLGKSHGNGAAKMKDTSSAVDLENKPNGTSAPSSKSLPTTFFPP